MKYEMGEPCGTTCMWERRGVFGKHEGRIQLRRPTRGWEDNIKMDPKGAGCTSVDWIVLLKFRYYFVVGTATALGGWTVCGSQ